MATFKKYRKQKLADRFPEIDFFEDDDSTFSAYLTINNKPYVLYYCFNFVNGVGYVSNYSNSRNLFTQEDKKRVKSLFQSIDFFIPEVDYSEIDQLILEDPEDATLHYDKAKRAFDYRNLELCLTECTAAIDLFPFYGEAFYLRAKVHLYLNDTLNACRDFSAALSEDFYSEENFPNFDRICENVDVWGEPEPLFPEFDENADHFAYVDSVSQHPYVITGGSSEPSDELKDQMEQVTHFYFLDYNQLNQAFADGNDIVKLYSFGLIVHRFPGQLNKEHKKLLKSKNLVDVYHGYDDGIQEQKVSDLAKEIYAFMSYQKKEAKAQVKVEKAIEKFIRKNAQFPESFEKVEFSDFRTLRIYDPEIDETEKNSESYSIKLNYTIKNKLGELVEAFHVFKLDYAFAINIIEEKMSGTVSSYPPEIEEWLELYGHELSVKEKSKFGLN